MWVLGFFPPQNNGSQLYFILSCNSPPPPPPAPPPPFSLVLFSLTICVWVFSQPWYTNNIWMGVKNQLFILLYIICNAGSQLCFRFLLCCLLQVSGQSSMMSFSSADCITAHVETAVKRVFPYALKYIQFGWRSKPHSQKQWWSRHFCRPHGILSLGKDWSYKVSVTCYYLIVFQCLASFYAGDWLTA